MPGKIIKLSANEPEKKWKVKLNNDRIRGYQKIVSGSFAASHLRKISPVPPQTGWRQLNERYWASRHGTQCPQCNGICPYCKNVSPCSRRERPLCRWLPNECSLCKGEGKVAPQTTLDYHTLCVCRTLACDKPDPNCGLCDGDGTMGRGKLEEVGLRALLGMHAPGLPRNDQGGWMKKTNPDRRRPRRRLLTSESAGYGPHDYASTRRRIRRLLASEAHLRRRSNLPPRV